MQNHDIAAGDGTCSASLLSQPAQLSIDRAHEGQVSRELFDR